MEMGNSLNYKWIVYQTTCKVNGKIYIGVHKTKNPDVFDGYIGGGYEIGYTIKNTKNAYARALKKYGYSNFIRTTIKIFDNEEEAYKLESEIVNLDFIKRRDTYNTALGGIHGTSYKKFYQYDLDGNFIKEWDSRESLLNFYNCYNDTDKFNRAVKNKWNIYNSYWTSEYIEKLDISQYKLNKFSEIYQFDKFGTILNTYSSAIQAAKENGISINSIYGCINKKSSIKGCFYTKNKNDIFNIIKLDSERILTDKAVSLYNSDKTLYKTFFTKKELSKFLGVSVKTITEYIKNQKQLNGFYIKLGFQKNYDEFKSNGLKINQYDLNGNLIKTWDTIAECAKEHPKVRLVLKGLRKHTHGFTFKICE